MHDVLSEEGKDSDENIDLKNITDLGIIEKMLGYQQETLEYIRPSKKILAQAEQEVTNIFNYLANYRNLSKDYFVTIVEKVDGILQTSNKQLEYLSTDVDKLNKKFLKNKFLNSADKAHKQMKTTIEQLKGLENRINRASAQVDELKTTLQGSQTFFDNFKTVVENLPSSLVTYCQPRGQNWTKLLSNLLLVFSRSWGNW